MRPVVPDHENAARICQEAFLRQVDWNYEATKHLPIVGEAQLPPCSEPLTEKMMADCEEYLSENAEAIKRLHLAAALKKARFPLDLSEGFLSRVDYLASIRQSGRLLHMDAIIHAERGDSAKAAESLLSLAAARSLEQEPLMYSRLVLMNLHMMHHAALERVMARVPLTDERLRQMAAALQSLDSPAGMEATWAFECCFMAYNRELVNGTPAPDEWPWPQRSYHSLLALGGMLGGYDIGQLKLLEGFEATMEVARCPMPDRPSAGRVVDARMRKSTYIIYQRQGWDMEVAGFFVSDLSFHVRLRSSLAALAVERYRLAHEGALPERFEALVPEYLPAVPEDPFTGKALLFKVKEKGYVVYSVGENGVDDGGSEARDAESSPLDVGFVMER